MIIVRYNLNSGIEQVAEMYHYFRKFNLKDEIIFLPQDWDVLFNCSTADLYYIKEQIENAIHDKEISEA